MERWPAASLASKASGLDRLDFVLLAPKPGERRPNDYKVLGAISAHGALVDGGDARSSIGVEPGSGEPMAKTRRRAAEP